MWDTGSRLDLDTGTGALERPEPCRVTFDSRFSRSRRLLYFVASRILGDSEHAERAVHNCYCSASRELQDFEHEGAFRSWLVRILINEALSILRERNDLMTPCASWNIPLKQASLQNE
jgi:DNA-directed RNA polymerase specialized sigma24 family protein